MTDPDLYVAAAEATGESHRGLALRVLGVDERTGRRWRSGESPIPEPVRRLLCVLIRYPTIARELSAAY